VLPWLVLLGRCCRACAVLMQHCLHTVESDDSVCELAAPSVGHAPTDYSEQAAAAAVQSGIHSGVAGWLDAACTERLLTAQGYQPQDLQQQLTAAVEALHALSNDLQASDALTDGHSVAVAVLQAQEQLLAANRVLACFAIPHACNNPTCGNLFGPSEAQLVGGRSCICAGCRTARYCGIACQRTA
jgi:hypothetical protein